MQTVQVEIAIKKKSSDLLSISSKGKYKSVKHTENKLHRSMNQYPIGSSWNLLIARWEIVMQYFFSTFIIVTYWMRTVPHYYPIMVW